MAIERNCIELGPCETGMKCAEQKGWDIFDTQMACISGSADAKRFTEGFSDALPAEAVGEFTCGVEIKIAFDKDTDVEQGEYNA